MLWCLVYFELIIVTLAAEPKWIQIEQRNSAPNGVRGLALDRSAMLSHIFSKDDLKYEDLVDVIGPGFEQDFLKFLDSSNGSSIVEDTTQLVAYDGTPFGSIEDEKYEENNGTKRVFSLDPLHNVIDLQSNASTSSNTRNDTTKHIQTQKKKVKENAIENERKLVVSVIDDEPVTQVDGKVFDMSDQTNARNNSDAKASQQSLEKTTKKKNLILKMVKIKPPPPPTFTDILKFLQEIQESLLVNAAGGIKNKIKSLEIFKNELISNIGVRLRAMWPSKVERSKRGIFDSHGHSLGFPSSEASLITIAFLTFAVFLIKLVLQVISTVKSKHYSFNAFDTFASVQSAGSPIKIINSNRNARHATDNDLPEMKNVMKSMENLQKLQ